VECYQPPPAELPRADRHTDNVFIPECNYIAREYGANLNEGRIFMQVILKYLYAGNFKVEFRKDYRASNKIRCDIIRYDDYDAIAGAT